MTFLRQLTELHAAVMIDTGAAVRWLGVTVTGG